MADRWTVGGPAAPDVAPVEVVEADSAVETPWRVIVFDDDIHTFEEVILQLMKAIGCTPEKGYEHALTIHTEGKDCVYQGDFFDCFRVQGVLKEIALVTEIEG